MSRSNQNKARGGFWQRLFDSLVTPTSGLAPLPAMEPGPTPAIGELTQVVINGAYGLAQERGHAVVTDWHMLAALLATDPVQRAIEASSGANRLIERLTFERIDDLPRRLGPRDAPELDPTSLHRATMQALGQRVPTITVLHLLSCVVLTPDVGDALSAAGINTTVLALWPRYKDRYPKSDVDVTDDEEVELLMHNDDTTTMEFVEAVLAEVLGFEAAEARKIMLTVHKEGFAVVGKMSADEAKLRAEAITEAARIESFPLLVTYRRARKPA